jgi:hypothetical protein
VVVVTAAIVADGGADVLGEAVDVLAEVLNGVGLKVGFASEGGIQVGDIRVVVATVVDFHGLLVDVGLERVVGVGEFGEGMGHKDWI